MPRPSSESGAPLRSLGLALQPRDLDLLEAVHRYRYATSQQLAQLLFPDRSLRVCQGRLQKLRAHDYLERYRLAGVVGDHRPRHQLAPAYALGVKGAALLAERSGLEPDAVRHGFHYRGSGAGTLEHHLLVTGLLVAVSCAARAEARIQRCETEHEWTLWQRLYVHEQRPRAGTYLVPDAAFTLTNSAGAGLTFYVEVVRAGVRGGNHGLSRKFRLYVDLLRSGFFGRTYGHGRLRAVLFVTSSAERAENLAQVAASLPHGRQLFWFGSYTTAELDSRRGDALAPESILEKRWRTAAGDFLSLIPPAPGRTLAPGAPDIHPHHDHEELHPDARCRAAPAAR